MNRDTCQANRNVFKNLDFHISGNATFHNNLVLDSVLFTQAWREGRAEFRYNSFMDTASTQIKLHQTGQNTSAVDNFWNTTNEKTIADMIHDKNDDPSLMDVVPFLPILSEPHTDTPNSTQYGNFPAICLVTVDERNNNIVVLEEYDINSLDSIYIYKETSITDEFELIGTLATGETEFIDQFSDATVKASIYNISVLDKYGYVSRKSKSHKTIHLSISKGINQDWNLSWQPYSGKDIRTYNIYRGSSSSNLEKIASTSGNITTYVDQDVQLSNVFYQIEVLFTESCFESGVSGRNENNYSSTKSNIASSITDGELNLINPNPAHDVINIDLPTDIEVKNIVIYDLKGHVVMKYAERLDQINISNLDDGLYFVVIKTSNLRIRTKLIVD